MDHYASQLLEHVDVNQRAVHLALDMQGWQPPAGLMARMHGRARNHRDVSGVLDL